MHDSAWSLTALQLIKYGLENFEFNHEHEYVTDAAIYYLAQHNFEDLPAKDLTAHMIMKAAGTHVKYAKVQLERELGIDIDKHPNVQNTLAASFVEPFIRLLELAAQKLINDKIKADGDKPVEELDLAAEAAACLMDEDPSRIDVSNKLHDPVGLSKTSD